MKDYLLIDSGNGRKLEQFGKHLLIRPASQAVWEPSHPKKWAKAASQFSREGPMKWTPAIQKPWEIEIDDCKFKLQTTDFGHLGIFPEQKENWRWIRDQVKKRGKISVLNLFAYSGASTLAAAMESASVCHLDASKGMCSWARENAALNNLEKAPIRWIVDDAEKFLLREIKRGNKYDAIILDPPSFGRGAKGEVFKIEENLPRLLHYCKQILSDRPAFVLFSCHTPGYTPVVMHHILYQMVGGEVTSGEMLLEGDLPLPSGTYARWENG